MLARVSTLLRFHKLDRPFLGQNDGDGVLNGLLMSGRTFSQHRYPKTFDARTIDLELIEISGKCDIQTLLLTLDCRKKDCGPDQVPSTVLKAVEKAALRLLEDQNPLAISNILHFFSKFTNADYPTPQFTAKLMTAAEQQIQSFNPHDIAMTLSSLSKLRRWRPSTSLLLAFEKRAIACSFEFAPQSIANSLTSLTKFPPFHPSHAYFDALENQAVSQMHSFQPLHIANTLNELSKFHRWQPSARFLATMADRTESALPNFSAKQLVLALSAFSKFSNSALKPEFFRTLCSRAQELLPRFDPGMIATLISALARFNQKFDAQFFADVEQRAVACIDDFEARNCTALLHGFTNLRHKDISAEFLEAMDRRATQLVGDLRPEFLANMLESVAGSFPRCPSAEFLEAVQLATLLKIEEFPPTAIAVSLRGWSHIPTCNPNPNYISAVERRTIECLDKGLFDAMSLSKCINTLLGIPGWPPSQHLLTALECQMNQQLEKNTQSPFRFRTRMRKSFEILKNQTEGAPPSNRLVEANVTFRNEG